MLTWNELYGPLFATEAYGVANRRRRMPKGSASMSLRAMIVEDETLIALELQSILEENGHEVLGVAASMRKALDVAKAHPGIDFAVMDVDLAGGSDGVETARRLREEFDVASLFVSAKLNDEVRARAAKWSPLGFIGKPFGEREILAALTALPGHTAA